jgi:DNA-binding beta-propeller fold protein YncE
MVNFRSFCATILIFLCFGFIYSDKPESNPFSGPVDLAFDADKELLFVAQKEGKRIDIINFETQKTIRSLILKDNPSKIYLSQNNRLLYNLQGIENGQLGVYDLYQYKRKKQIPVGHSPVDLVANATHFIICHRFPGEISFMNKNNYRIEKRLHVGREPVVMELHPEKDLLFVAHHIPEMASLADTIASKVTVLDTKKMNILNTFLLPNGSSSVRGMDIDPKGDHLFISHIISRFNLPASQLERGWMNTNALSIVDANHQKLWGTVLLDDIDHGAANPWAVQCAEDGNVIYISHAGTHEISIIDWAKMKKALETPRDNSGHIHITENLSFIYNFRKRIKVQGNGPRALALVKDYIISANYFSDNLSLIHLQELKEMNISFGNTPLPIEVWGEMHFNDASLCFQKWQSCASCHPDARVDGFNWDLLNDGIGNPKNTKSLVLSYLTPPAMSLGVRTHAEKATRAGFQHIQFVNIPEEQAEKVDVYLFSLKPTSSPNQLTKGQLKLGKSLYFSLDCQNCHPPPTYTNLKSYALTQDTTRRWDTPTLVELWRTGPYWHDGRYATLKDLFIEEMHGLKQPLVEKDLNILESYLLTL